MNASSHELGRTDKERRQCDKSESFSRSVLIDGRHQGDEDRLKENDREKLNSTSFDDREECAG